jgi:hypothetical protein
LKTTNYNWEIKMSSQSVAKNKQNYCSKPISKTCANCKYFTQTFYHYSKDGIRVEGKNQDERSYANPTYSDNLRCGIGGFAIKKTATCDNMEYVDDEHN